MTDTYGALWVSYSSISDFLTCPRAYFLNNVYKNPKSGKKISIISPPLALGQVIHSVVESLSTVPVTKRFQEPLMERFNDEWQKVAGEKGGFSSEAEEETFKRRGQDMIRRVIKNPGPLQNLAVKIPQDLLHYWLSKDDNILLCGKIDWLEFIEGENAIHIIDFKTGKKEEGDGSLQLPIYYLLAKNTQNRPVKKMSYWYLEFADEPHEAPLPDEEKTSEEVLKIAKDIKLARALERFKCPRGVNGCRRCRPFESILQGRATLIGTNDFNAEVYVVERTSATSESTPL